ncbi:MAG: GNAT family N-acetyltransferase [Hyphomicrobiales bacterium]
MATGDDRPLGEKLDYLPPNVWPDGRMLYGASVVLQKLDMNVHGEDLWQAFSVDEKGAIWDYLPYGPFASRSGLDECYGQLGACGDPLFYAIVPNSSGRAEGVASYLNIVPANGTIEIGHINLAPSLQRTYEATEALFLMMRHAMDDLGNRRLEWKCNANNAASCRAAERLGFTFEGVFRQHIVVKGRNRDSAWFSIIDKEWPGLREAYFAWLKPENFSREGKQKKALSKLTKAALKAIGN